MTLDTFPRPVCDAQDHDSEAEYLACPVCHPPPPPPVEDVLRDIRVAIRPRVAAWQAARRERAGAEEPMCGRLFEDRQRNEGICWLNAGHRGGCVGSPVVRE